MHNTPHSPHSPPSHPRHSPSPSGKTLSMQEKILLLDPHPSKTLAVQARAPSRVDVDHSQVLKLDPEKRLLTLSNGRVVRFDQCLIAVGSAPAPLNPTFVDSVGDLKDSFVDLNGEGYGGGYGG
ncbi:hypothetical protein B484DRAFT_423691, partial [Ochromonadaceae sp. CCMP2298]